MRCITASLPTLGDYPVFFHSESAALVNELARRELPRLNRVAHLGLAASVFTGTNHRRLEYALLQCAAIAVLKKLHADTASLGLSATVAIPGVEGKISSAEELLKCWALLGNIGHPQYTYGVEKPLLQFARVNVGFRRGLLASVSANAKPWADRVIAKYDVVNFHYVLAYYRIQHTFPTNSRLKRKCRLYLDALLVPEQELEMSSVAMRRLLHLRKVYSLVRLLSIVGLDSHYSHHPLRLQFAGTLLGISSYLTHGRIDSSLFQILGTTAASIAETLYLHPRVLAAQIAYERIAQEKLTRIANRGQLIGSGMTRRMADWFEDGFGYPQPEFLEPYLRLKLESWSRPLLGDPDIFVTVQQLRQQICVPDVTFLSVDRNPFSSEIYVDLFLRSGRASVGDLMVTTARTYRWLLRTIEAEVLIRSRIARQKIDSLYSALLRRNSERLLARRRMHFMALMFRFLEYLLPAGYSLSVPEFVDGVADPSVIRFRLPFANLSDVDEISPFYARDNIRDSSRARQHDELLQKAVIEKMSMTLLAVCPYGICIQNQHGKRVDEWDGAVLAVENEHVTVRIFEAKGGGGKGSRANDAFRQLTETVKMIRKAHKGIRTRRKRVGKLGAYLEITI